MKHSVATLTLTLALGTSATFAENWPQFRGLLRDNVSRETGLLKSWPEGGPKRVWLSTNLGSGYSSPAIVGEKIFIMSQRNDAQWLFCLDVKSGNELWATRFGGPYANAFGDVRVFALGANGELLCANAATDKKHWRAGFTEPGGKVPGWGYSESPLVDGATARCRPRPSLPA